MSYLRFRPLKFANDPDVAGALFAWPVCAIQIQYWAVAASAVDLLERSLLALAEARVTVPQQMTALLGIPDSMAAMVTRSLNQLCVQGYLTESYQPTEQGYTALRDEQFLAKDFRQGWLLYDLVRGGFFPIVQDGRLSFFKTQAIDQLKPFSVTPALSLPSESQLIREANAAVATYNRRLALLEALGDDVADGEEWELDLPITAYASEQVDDIRLLPLDLAEYHHLLVEVLAEVRPGETHSVLSAYSVFSGWEQDSYLEILRASKDLAVRTYLKSLEQRAHELVKESLLGELGQAEGDVWSRLADKIATALDVPVKLPDDLVDKLLACEYGQELAKESYRLNLPFNRESVINSWGVFLEAALKVVTAEIKDWQIPPSWRHLKFKDKDRALKWYTDLVMHLGRGSALVQLPQGIRSNVANVIRYSLSDTFGSIRGSSSRDQVAKVLLANLTDTTVVLPLHCRRLIAAIESDNSLLSGIDEVVEWRNACGHADSKIRINESSAEEFEQVLERVRASIYQLLRAIFYR